VKKKQDKAPDSAELRRSAEERLKRQKSKGVGQKTEVESVRLFHELQVHQIELEMQNEELRRAGEEVETGLERYTELYDFAPVGFLTLNNDGVILQVNLTGARLLGVERTRLVNRRFGLFVSAHARPAFNIFFKRIFESRTKEVCEVALCAEEDRPLYADIQGQVTEDGRECRLVFQDITERRQIQAEREQLIKELQDALARVKILSGLLPICANCKKIRDDRGYWEHVESYIESHSGATFTHGFCPECLKKLYPGYSK